MDPIHLHCPDSLFAGDDRIVTNFASGLVRVQQTYYCPPEGVAAARVLLTPGQPIPDGDTTPAIDGLYIYPDAQEVGGQYGMKEFRVTAYGRSGSEPRDLIMTEKRWNQRVNGSATESLSYSVYEPSGVVCITEADELEYANFGLHESTLLPFNVRYSDGTTLWSVGTVVPFGEPITGPYADGVLALLIPPGGFNRPLFDTPPGVNYGIQAYVATFKSDDFPDKELGFYVYTPAIKVTNQQSYGRYIEVTFTTERRATFL